jgi:hypothetical protein
LSATLTGVHKQFATALQAVAFKKKRVNEKSALYILSCFAMQFSITIGTNRTRRDKVK